MEYLMEDEPENCPFTAAWKLMRINKFIRTVLKLDPGKGPIKKADLRRELDSNKIPEIYGDEELKQLFSAMDEDEYVRYETLLKTGLRKKELMYLEEADALIDLATGGKKKREVKVERKDHYRFIPKNGKSRSIPIPLDLAEKLLKLKRTKRPSKCYSAHAPGSRMDTC
jgi:integrase